jgi:hypothetical protein
MNESPTMISTGFLRTLRARFFMIRGKVTLNMINGDLVGLVDERLHLRGETHVPQSICLIQDEISPTVGTGRLLNHILMMNHPGWCYSSNKKGKRRHTILWVAKAGRTGFPMEKSTEMTREDPELDVMRECRWTSFDWNKRNVSRNINRYGKMIRLTKDTTMVMKGVSMSTTLSWAKSYW